MVHLDKVVLILFDTVICQGAIGAIILIDHNIENPLTEIESYLETFQNYTDNIAIGITHTDEIKTEPYRVCRRPTFLRECSDEKTKIYP